jgi:hypothetical protein
VQKSTMERIYSYDLLLSKAMLDEGLSNLGDTSNLRRAVHKLVTGMFPVRHRCSLSVDDGEAVEWGCTNGDPG